MTRREIEQWCTARKIELRIENWSRTTHVHVNIDASRKIFKAHGLHNLALWDDAKSPNWHAIGEELIAADYGDCTNLDCEYCRE